MVKPLFFPGGDIGKLAVNGTVNDLAVGGAEPLYLSAAFILEEGLALDDLRRIVASMRAACDLAGVSLVTGDTKVVDRGKGDQVFITTAGIGVVSPGSALSISGRPARRLHRGSGTIGDHGIAIMSVREGIEFETVLESDCAPSDRPDPGHARRLPQHPRNARPDPRRRLERLERAGAGLAASGVRIDEKAIPVRPEVRAACEMLGLDPLYVANEGKLIAVVPERRRRSPARSHARSSAWARRLHDRRSRRRAPGHGHDALADRRRANRHPINRRTTAENLLSRPMRR